MNIFKGIELVFSSLATAFSYSFTVGQYSFPLYIMVMGGLILRMSWTLLRKLFEIFLG